MKRFHFSLSVIFVAETEAQSLTQHEDTQTDHQSEGEASKSPPTLFHEVSAMPPPPQDSPQTELAPRKRRRKRDDPQNCLTNSEVSDRLYLLFGKVFNASFYT